MRPNYSKGAAQSSPVRLPSVEYHIQSNLVESWTLCDGRRFWRVHGFESRRVTSSSCREGRPWPATVVRKDFVIWMRVTVRRREWRDSTSNTCWMQIYLEIWSLIRWFLKSEDLEVNKKQSSELETKLNRHKNWKLLFVRTNCRDGIQFLRQDGDFPLPAQIFSTFESQELKECNNKLWL